MIIGRHVLVTGGTGSLGNALVRRLLEAGADGPETITILSRDETKQQAMRLAIAERGAATDDVIYRDADKRVRFRLGSVADPRAVARALKGIDVVFHAAALKQVPGCEYFPMEAVRTNVEGAHVLASTIAELDLPVQTVVGVSTDKACKPVNVMGMTKALQERVLIEANLARPETRFVLARYGNVLGSRGSVIPLFHEQIRAGGPVTITSEAMTRFCMSLDEAVDTVLAAAEHALPGETYIPRVPSARVVDLAAGLIGDRRVPIETVGIRPGEKIHEILVSEEEAPRTVERGDHLAIQPLLPELGGSTTESALEGVEYSSADGTLSLDDTAALLSRHRLHLADVALGNPGPVDTNGRL